MIIAIDFDGTCVTHEYPYVGKEIGAVPVLQELVQKGHKLLLWTMRSNKELEEAEAWFKDHGITLWASNKNPEQTWTTSNKQYAHIYIDDTALGCPLKYNPALSKRPFADWDKIRDYLQTLGAL